MAPPFSRPRIALNQTSVLICLATFIAAASATKGFGSGNAMSGLDGVEAFLGIWIGGAWGRV